MQTDAPRDSPTVWNRQSITELLTRELARSESSGSNLVVLLAAVEIPKSTNPELAESQNNILLIEIAKRLSASLRPYDYVGRYAPKQFLILVPGWDPASAITLAEKLRSSVTESQIDLFGSRVRVTVSFVPSTTADFKSHDQQQILTKLEEALARAEANGGNRIESLGNVVESGHQRPRRQHWLRISWALGGLFTAGLVALFFIVPSWTCVPNLIGDILDSRELPPPLPANCVLTAEHPSEATIQSMERRNEVGQLEFQGRVTCKISISSKAHPGRFDEQQWLGTLYSDGKLQYRRHVLIAASEDVPGGKLFTVEQYVTPWWRYLAQSQEYCRVQDSPWK